MSRTSKLHNSQLTPSPVLKLNSEFAHKIKKNKSTYAVRIQTKLFENRIFYSENIFLPVIYFICIPLRIYQSSRRSALPPPDSLRKKNGDREGTPHWGVILDK